MHINRTRTCSSFGNRTGTPYFWLQTIEHPTSNIVRPITSFQSIFLFFFIQLTFQSFELLATQCKFVFLRMTSVIHHSGNRKKEIERSCHLRKLFFCHLIFQQQFSNSGRRQSRKVSKLENFSHPKTWWQVLT